MKHYALTQMQIKDAPEGMYGEGQGLWLVKREKALGKWVLRIFLNGKRRVMGPPPVIFYRREARDLEPG